MFLFCPSLRPRPNAIETRNARHVRISSTTSLLSAPRLPVPPQRQRVLQLPGVPPALLGVVVAMALVQTSALLASRGQATHLTMLVDWVDDPVDAWVLADGLVLWVDEDDFVVLVGAVLVDPVAVEDAEIGAAASDTLLSGGLEGALVLELVDTLVGRLACFRLSAYVLRNALFESLLTERGTLWYRLLPATSPHTHTVDDIALLGLVSETASLVGAGWAGGAVDDVELAELD